MTDNKVLTYDDAEAVIERFDFEKVRSFMILTKWYYRGEKEAPSIDELKRTARSSLYSVVTSPSATQNSGTGGFTAYKLPWGLALHFSLEYKATY